MGDKSLLICFFAGLCLAQGATAHRVLARQFSNSSAVAISTQSSNFDAQSSTFSHVSAASSSSTTSTLRLVAQAAVSQSFGLELTATATASTTIWVSANANGPPTSSLAESASDGVSTTMTASTVLFSPLSSATSDAPSFSTLRTLPPSTQLKIDISGSSVARSTAESSFTVIPGDFATNSSRTVSISSNLPTISTANPVNVIESIISEILRPSTRPNGTATRTQPISIPQVPTLFTSSTRRPSATSTRTLTAYTSTSTSTSTAPSTRTLTSYTSTSTTTSTAPPTHINPFATFNSSSSSSPSSSSGSPTVPSSTSSATPPPSPPSTQLSSRAIAGITVGVVGAAAIGAAGLLYFLRRRHSQRHLLDDDDDEGAGNGRVYPEVAYLYDPQVTPPSSIHRSNSPSFGGHGNAPVPAAESSKLLGSGAVGAGAAAVVGAMRGGRAAPPSSPNPTPPRHQDRGRGYGNPNLENVAQSPREVEMAEQRGERWPLAAGSPDPETAAGAGGLSPRVDPLRGNPSRGAEAVTPEMERVRMRWWS